MKLSPIAPVAAVRRGLPLFLLLLSGLVWTGGAVAYAQPAPQGESVQRVEIEGLTGYAPEQVLGRLKTQAGQPYQPLALREDLTLLSRTMRTATVRVDPAPEGGVIVRFSVSEFPRLRQWQVIGNEQLSTGRIEGLLKLQPGQTLLDSNQLESSRRALRQEYGAQGMPQAKVSMNLIEVAATADAATTPGAPQADLQIVIEEGRPVVCRDVIVRGNDAFSALRLRTLLKTRGSLGPLKNYYDEETFEEDLKVLRDFYAGHGYFDARIERGSFEQGSRGGTAELSPVIQISEGGRYRLGAVEVSGARLFGNAEIAVYFEPLQGELFSGRRLMEAIGKVQELYSSHGLLTTEITPVYSYQAEERRIDVRLEIAERNRIYVGRIQLVRPRYEEPGDETGWFRGWYQRVSPELSDQAILGELLLEPGDIYNRKLEQDSVRRLGRLGVLEEQSLRAYNQPTADPGIHDMVLEVQETVSGMLTGGIGYGDASGVFAYGIFSERNVGGQANVLTVEATVGSEASSAGVSYLDRHLGDSNDTLRSRLFYQQLDRPGYEADVVGVHSEWGHPLAGEWVRYLRARVEYVDLEKETGIHAREDLDQDYGVATLRLRFEEDTRTAGSGWRRRGHVQSAGIEAGYADDLYTALEVLRDQYVPVSESLTWRLYAMAGLMPYDRDQVPIHERYFLGGNNDLRGFAYRGAGYRDSADDDVPIGGAGKVLVKNELLFPIFDPVSGLVFADVGALGENPAQWGRPRASTGVGVRFDMKRVQVGVDAALPVIDRDDDRTRYFHFSLESRF